MKTVTYSANAAAEMVGRDRRVMSRILREVTRDAGTAGKPQWTAKSIIRAVLDYEQPKGVVENERQALLREQKIAQQRKNALAAGQLLDAGEVEAKWSAILRTVRAGMLTVPTRVAQRSPHLSVRDVSEIDLEVRAVLTQIGEGK